MTTRRFITIFALISFLITSQIVQATSTGREPIEPTDRSGSQLTIPLNPGVVWDTSTQAVNADYAQPGQRITYWTLAKSHSA
jgi:hypothetical protein